MPENGKLGRRQDLCVHWGGCVPWTIRRAAGWLSSLMVTSSKRGGAECAERRGGSWRGKSTSSDEPCDGDSCSSVVLVVEHPRVRLLSHRVEELEHQVRVHWHKSSTQWSRTSDAKVSCTCRGWKSCLVAWCASASKRTCDTLLGEPSKWRHARLVIHIISYNLNLPNQSG